MGADLASLLEQQYAEVLITGFISELFETDCGTETSGTCGNNERQ